VDGASLQVPHANSDISFRCSTAAILLLFLARFKSPAILAINLCFVGHVSNYATRMNYETNKICKKKFHSRKNETFLKSRVINP
jgi:hypothetical protein